VSASSKKLIGQDAKLGRKQKLSKKPTKKPAKKAVARIPKEAKDALNSLEKDVQNALRELKKVIPTPEKIQQDAEQMRDDAEKGISHVHSLIDKYVANANVSPDL
jgi:hypothetical protein